MQLLFAVPAGASATRARLTPTASHTTQITEVNSLGALWAALLNGAYNAALVADDIEWAEPVQVIRDIAAVAAGLPQILIGYRRDPAVAAAAGRAGAYYLAAGDTAQLAEAVTAAQSEARLREARVALRASQERARMFGELSSAYVIEVAVRPDGTREPIWLTQAFTTITGYTAPEVDARGGYRTIVHPHDLPHYDALIDQLLGGKAAVAEYRIIRKDGAIRWLRVSIHPEPDRDTPGATRWLGAGQDITRQKAAEDELARSIADHTAAIEAANAQLQHELTERLHAEAGLRRSEELLRMILASMPVMLDAMDDDNRIVVWNQECERVTGYSAEEMLGRSDYMELLYPDPVYRERIVSDWYERGASCRSWDLTLTRKDGNQRVVSWSNIATDFPVPGWRTWGVGVDSTSQRRAEEARLLLERNLLETQKLESLGILAGGIAHDFNNLLAVIIGNTDLLLLDMPPGTPGIALLEKIERTARRATDLMKQLLIYAGRNSTAVAPLHLNELVVEMTDLLQTTIGKRVSLTMRLAPQLPVIEGDATQLRQVLMNLVVNASEATASAALSHDPLVQQGHSHSGEQAGSITITTGVRTAEREELDAALLGANLSPGQYVELLVTDTGVGMSETTLARIFEPFFTTKFTGRGLGLAAVLGIVRTHGGALQVQSAPGEGSSFRLLLPFVTTSAVAAPVVQSAASAWRGRGTVLVIDDEPSVADLAAAVARRLGFETLVAHGGEEGLELLHTRAEPIACVLLDLTMPHMSGMHVFAEIRQHWPELPVVLMSGYNTEEYEEAVHGKNAAFLKKPFAIAELREVLRDATGG